MTKPASVAPPLSTPGSVKKLPKRNTVTSFGGDSEWDEDGDEDDNIDTKQLFTILLKRYRSLKWLYGHTSR